MRKVTHASIAFIFVSTFAIAICATAKTQEKIVEEQTARDALSGLAAVWKEPGDSNGAGLSADDDPVWKVRMKSLVTLARLGPKIIPVLIATLKEGPPASRILAAQALGLFAVPGSRPALEAALSDGQGQVRFYAVRALSAFGRLEPLERYRQIRDGDANWRVQVEMAFALTRQDAADPNALRTQLARYDLKKMDSARLGQRAPDFSLTDSGGKEFRLSQFRGKNSVVLVFRVHNT